ncbi:MAG TPA: Na+/H+ antiporter NhaC family protein [Candidatus Aminicenantes bacterium]|nr:Na+/H+ antiporter NhaC family protein [Candidatus Aminicenantes bacterium]
MKARFRFNTLVMIYAIVIAVAALTWIVPGGAYQRVEKDGRTQIVSGSFAAAESRPQGPGAVLIAPMKGFVQAGQIIVFLFILGGAFQIIEKTGALALGVRRTACTFARRPELQKFFIPVTVTLFSLAGAIFGMCEETMPFVLIFIPLAISLGYDSLVGTAIPFLGAAAGFAGAIFNPFTIGIAQSISELPLYSGIAYRIPIWFISTGSIIFFLSRYAARIRRDPTKSPVYELDRARALAPADAGGDPGPMPWNVRVILLLFLASIAVLVFGILRYRWYINEIAAVFFAFGLLAGLFGRLSFSQMADEFKEGARNMVGVALIIACARAILVIAVDGRVMDPFLHALSGAIAGLHPVLAAQSMFVAHGVINFFVHSGTSQAALTMPLMSPLADIVGITRQTAVLAFQFGDGWINPILPTSGVTMGVLGLAGIAWEKWFKWLFRLQVYFFVIALLLLVPPVMMFFYGPH